MSRIKEVYVLYHRIPTTAALNTSQDLLEVHFRRSIFLPLMDTFISGLTARFDKNRSILEGFGAQLKKICLYIKNNFFTKL